MIKTFKGTLFQISRTNPNLASGPVLNVAAVIHTSLAIDALTLSAEQARLQIVTTLL